MTDVEHLNKPNDQIDLDIEIPNTNEKQATPRRCPNHPVKNPTNKGKFTTEKRRKREVKKIIRQVQEDGAFVADPMTVARNRRNEKRLKDALAMRENLEL